MELLDRRQGPLRGRRAGTGLDALRRPHPPRRADFFAGLELLEPGVVSTSHWRPEAVPFGMPETVDAACGLARGP
ncbi:SAM-dependent methyltransferase [Actinomadura luteofluorescens]|uniref:SAM-dependent methyltransferase n=1 Tax=Actinomadura luteofluorescens TaxID=46163 RepID=UPI00347CE592